jgi:hypothetical protein
VDRPFRVRESSSGESLAATFQAGQTYAEMVATARSQSDLFAHFRGRAAAAPEYLARIERTGRRWHLLPVSEDWCGDSVNILPWVDALDAGSPLVELRVIERDQHLDLMDQHLTNGRSRSIPIVILLDDRFVERAWWGPRGLEMQRWFATPEAQALSKDARYKELRIRYSRDRGRAILDEITSMIEFAAAQDAAPGAPQAAPAASSDPTIASAAP